MWYPFNFQWTTKTTLMNMKEEAYNIRGWHTFFLWIKSFCVIKNIYHSILWWYECEKGREMCDKYELCWCCGFYTRHITYNAYNTDFLPPFSLCVCVFLLLLRWKWLYTIRYFFCKCFWHPLFFFGNIEFQVILTTAMAVVVKCFTTSSFDPHQFFILVVFLTLVSFPNT